MSLRAFDLCVMCRPMLPLRFDAEVFHTSARIAWCCRACSEMDARQWRRSWTPPGKPSPLERLSL